MRLTSRWSTTVNLGAMRSLQPATFRACMWALMEFWTGATFVFRLKFAHYWKSLSAAPEIEGRGRQMVQGDEQIIKCASIDQDLTQIELRGDAVFWLAPAASPNGGA